MKSLLFAIVLLSTFLSLSITLKAQDETVTVISIKANLRGTPSMSGIVVTSVNQGDVFELITTKGAWYLVQTPKYVGWLHGNSIRLDDGTSSDYDEPTPRTTTAPVSGGSSPFQSEYVGGERTVISVNNTAKRTLTLTFGGVRYVIPDGGSKVIVADGGAYEFLATAPGVRSMSGVKQFDRGFRYSWTFYVVTTVR